LDVPAGCTLRRLARRGGLGVLKHTEPCCLSLL
jgi:hypothetical protein